MENLKKKKRDELIAIIENFENIEKSRRKTSLNNCTISVNANELPEEIEVYQNISSALNNLTELLLAKKQRAVYGVYIGNDIETGA